MSKFNFRNSPDFNGQDVFRTTTTVENLLKAFGKGELHTYKNNRGGNLKPTHVKKICNEFRPASLGEFTLTYNSEASSYEFRDGHHRMAAIVMRKDTFGLSEKELNTPVNLSVHPYESRTISYVDSNMQAHHTSKDKIQNPDLSAGRITYEIIEEACKRVDVDPKVVNHSMALCLFDAVIANSTLSSRDLKFEDLIQGRATISSNKLLDKIYEFEPFRLTKKTKEMFVDAVFEYLYIRDLVIEELESQNSKKTTFGKAVLDGIGKAGFFSAIIVDAVSADPKIVTQADRTLVKKIVNEKKYVELVQLSAALSRRNGPELNLTQAPTAIVKLLGKRSNKISKGKLNNL